MISGRRRHVIACYPSFTILFISTDESWNVDL